MNALAQFTPVAGPDQSPLPDPLAWAAPGPETRPWTRWWWLGSAVDETNLSRILLEFRDAGIGGVEICPVYGVKGAEDRFIPFLSPRWVQMLGYTLREADRLGLAVDLTTGTGWPFGGPWVTAHDASAHLHLKAFDAEPGAAPEIDLPKGTLRCLMAVSDQGEQLDLTGKVVNGKLQWTAPPHRWRLYALVTQSPIQKVKRAAPGAEGDVVNPYSIPALNRYLSEFDKAFAALNGGMPRAQFHDSFEYYGADWAPDFFEQFERLRGYDLRTRLPALFGEGPPETAARVQHDYRETLSDLHIAWIERWTDWAHGHGSLTRNQAHGAPANLIDLYSAADIPETEIFGGLHEQNILMNKLASSAAHLSGRRWSAAESFTWLTDHFQATPAMVKNAADRLFLTGVNHVLFHGIPYSPAAAPWPGWQFYAAVNFGPQGGLWGDLPGLNSYITRCQSVLQHGMPANDVLLYFPIHDFWQTTGRLLTPFTVEQANRWLGAHPVHQDAAFLWDHGYGYDVISDRLIRQAQVDHGAIVVNGNRYRVLWIPETKCMPETTLLKLVELACKGAVVLVQNRLPGDVPGLGQFEFRRAALDRARQELRFEPGEVARATVGAGCFLQSTNPAAMLSAAGVKREPCADAGLRFVRRSHAEGWHYFFVHCGREPVNGWVTLATPAASALAMDPRANDRIGKAVLRQLDGATQVYLQLQPDESLILRTFTNRDVRAPAWPCFESAGPAHTVAGLWQIRFLEGGPELPDPCETDALDSWTRLGKRELDRFSGTARYRIELERPPGPAEDWLLDLGNVCETARIQLNGQEVAVLWSPPFEVRVGQWLRPGRNILEVDVTNLAANRVRDLDRRGVNWKYFYDLNVVNRDYKPLDASTWPVRDSGLLGPVRLKPVRQLRLPE